LACGLYSLVIRELLAGVDANTAVAQALRSFRAFYEADAYWAVEVDSFQLLLAGDLGDRPESEIDSSGYVVHTLTASLWCLLTTSGFEECVLRAVNLGGDTDTTGCVAGGLAGVYYGLNAIPGKWLQALARRDEIESLFNDLAALIPEVA
jgi:ADP-ribosylglycohydrolase